MGSFSFSGDVLVIRRIDKSPSNLRPLKAHSSSAIGNRMRNTERVEEGEKRDGSNGKEFESKSSGTARATIPTRTRKWNDASYLERRGGRWRQGSSGRWPGRGTRRGPSCAPARSWGRTSACRASPAPGCATSPPLRWCTRPASPAVAINNSDPIAVKSIGCGSNRPDMATLRGRRGRPDSCLVTILAIIWMMRVDARWRPNNSREDRRIQPQLTTA